MSFQPTAPASGVVASSGGATNGKRNPVLLVIGVVFVVVGVVAGLFLISKASSSVGDNVAKLARAPGGCTTSLEFDTTGEFLVFYESKGKVGDPGGDCSANGASFDRGDDHPPPQTLTLVDAKDKQIKLADASGTSYDDGGFKGTEISKARIDDAGVYLLTVAPNNADETGYAIAIGKDPTGDEGTLKAVGLGVLIAGLVIGALLIFPGLRKRGGGQPPIVTAIPANNWGSGGPTTAWQPQPQPAPMWPPQPPASPPGFGAPPSYAPPTSSPPTSSPSPTAQERPSTHPFSPPRPPDV
jgi:hypothetical protein